MSQIIYSCNQCQSHWLAAFWPLQACASFGISGNRQVGLYCRRAGVRPYARAATACGGHKAGAARRGAEVLEAEVRGQAEDRAAATAAQKAAFKKTYTGPQIPALDGKEKAKYAYLKKLPAFEEARAACGSQAEARSKW